MHRTRCSCTAVYAASRAGDVLSTSRTDESGQCTSRLPAGTYRLTGCSMRHQRGDDDCYVGESVVVDGAGDVTVMVDCPMG